MSSIVLFPRDEYGLLQVFVLGMLAGALLPLRRPRAWLGTLAFFAGSLMVAWLAVRGEGRAFGVPLATALIFAVAWGATYRREVLPRVTTAGAMDVVMLAAYGAWALWRMHGSPFAPRAWQVVVGVIGALGVALPVLASWAPLARWRPVRVAAYLDVLLALVAVVVLQWALADPATLARGGAFPTSLFAFAFFAGAGFLFVVFAGLQVLLLMPPESHASQRAMWDRVTGPLETQERQAEMLSAAFAASSSATAWMVVTGHALLIAANAWGGWVEPEIALGISMAGLAASSAGGRRPAKST